MSSTRIILLVFIAMFISAFFLFGLGDYLTLEVLKEQQLAMENYRAKSPLLTAFIYVALYIAVTSLSLPGATILTLAGAGIFGLFWGTVIVSFASTIGATLAFLAARFLFRENIDAKFGQRLSIINEGIERDGILYLLSLRLVPVFPFFMINLLMGLTHMRTLTYYWVSQLGMLPGTLVYVNAGTQLAKIESLADILSPEVLISFVLLGVFPLLAKKVIPFVESKKNG